jgi:thermitase
MSLIIALVLGFSTSVAQTSIYAPATREGRVDLHAPAVPGQFLVKFKDGLARRDREAVIGPLGGRFFDRIEAQDVDAVEFPALVKGGSIEATQVVLNALTQNPDVQYVEPNYIYYASYTPNDPLIGYQYAWTNIQAYSAWDVTQGFTDTVIAILDTGIQRDHPDLDAKIVAGYDFVDGDTEPDDGHGHGTAVAGTSAAETNNGEGGAGTCPECKLMPVRVLDNSGTGTLVDVVNGINFAADNGAKVVNLSLGGFGNVATLQNAVDYAWDQGVFLACAAGNDNASRPTYPAGYSNCFAVAASTSSDERASFSNYGLWVEVAAPGVSIVTTWIDNTYTYASGTSVAAPHVAGLAGLLASQGLTNAQIKQRICDTADHINGTGSAWTCGRINAFGAVTSSGGTPTSTPTSTPAPAPTQCAIAFSDVPASSAFYGFIRCLACRGIISGYSDNTFRPNNDITRGQIAKTVSNAAGYVDDVTGRQTYSDVPPGSTFWLWIERLSAHNAMSGYNCGGPGEPCDSGNKPYFRPGNNATRGQLSKIVSIAADFQDPPGGQTFEDVPPASTFYTWIERLASRGIMGGYNCGSPGEACLPPGDRPYFRPNNNVTRGQAAKIVANAFFPDCATP